MGRSCQQSRLLVVALTVAIVVAGCQRPDSLGGMEPITPTPSPAPTTTPDAAPVIEPTPSPLPEPDAVRPPAEVVAFTDPGELAAVLAQAEAALADPDTPADDRDGWARVHQQAYRDLAANPAWADQARQAVPAELQDAFDLTLRATRELRQLTSPRESLPTDWRIVAPPPVDELRVYYAQAEDTFDVPWSVLAAIHLVETRFGRIQGDSHAGAQGPMQFMPRTWEAYGEGDVHDPRDAILAAGRYLAASGAPHDLRRALFAYNRSDHYVEAILAHAQAMASHDHYLDVYHRWRVYYRTVDGDVILEEGYGS